MSESKPTQDEIDDQMFDDDDCPNCDGSGFMESCFEDTCVCVDPPCCWNRCDWCNHDGRKGRGLRVRHTVRLGGSVCVAMCGFGLRVCPLLAFVVLNSPIKSMISGPGC